MDDPCRKISLYETFLREGYEEGTYFPQNNIDLEKLCRSCLQEAYESENLFRKNCKISLSNEETFKLLGNMFREISATDVDEFDNLPHQICGRCIETVHIAYKFRMQCQKAETLLLRLIETTANVDKVDANTLEGSPYKQDEDNIPLLDADITFEENDDNKMLEIVFEGNQYEIEESIDSSAMENYDSTNGQQKRIDEIKEFEVEFLQRNCADYGNIENDHTVSDGKRRRYNCAHCDEVFDKKREMNDHQKHEHPESCIFECEICNARFSNSQTLKRHKKIHQADQKNKLCTFCGKRFTRADDLKRHIRIHTGEKPYACPECPKRFKQTSELKEHMETHSKNRVFVCTICGKCLLTRNGHYVHMKVHKGLKNHVCFCGNRYVTSGELNSHIRHIHDKTNRYSCLLENCKRSFASKKSLKIHIRSHEERPYSCTVCDKQLISTSSLIEHMKIHSDKKCICTICGIALSSIHTLNKHMKKHTENKDNIDTDNDSDKVILQCNFCEREFNSFSAIEKHFLTHEEYVEKIRNMSTTKDDRIINKKSVEICTIDESDSNKDILS